MWICLQSTPKLMKWWWWTKQKKICCKFFLAFVLLQLFKSPADSVCIEHYMLITLTWLQVSMCWWTSNIVLLCILHFRCINCVYSSSDDDCYVKSIDVKTIKVSTYSTSYLTDQMVVMNKKRSRLVANCSFRLDYINCWDLPQTVLLHGYHPDLTTSKYVLMNNPVFRTILHFCCINCVYSSSDDDCYKQPFGVEKSKHQPTAVLHFLFLAISTKTHQML